MILFTGKGTSGSWQIRGVQIAHAMRVRAVPMAGDAECRAADVIVGVKRIPDDLLVRIRRSGRPWIWDCVDAYPQRPHQPVTRDDAIRWMRAELERLRPDGVIWPNREMRSDAGFGHVIPHHHWPGLSPQPLRDRIEVIGYEGSPRYIEAWMPHIERECRRIGARFQPSLPGADVVLALRGPEWGSYWCRNWKSGVKLANAHGAGVPFIGAMEPGYLEIATGVERWADTPDALSLALDSLASVDVRRQVRGEFLAAAMPVDAVVPMYREVISAVR